MSDLATNPQGEEDVRALSAPGVADAVSAAGAFDDDARFASDALADDQDGAEDEDDPGALEDVEHEGRRYQVPKALKDAFLRHADYTRKTQELAEQRRAVEAQASEHIEAEHHRLAGYARLMAVDDQLQAYEQIDWNSLESQDPVRAQRLWREYSQLKDGRAELTGQIQDFEAQRAFETQRQAARRIEDGHQQLSREIKDWSPQLATKLSDFGQRAFGFSASELDAVDDPRMIKVLHLAWLGDQTLKTQAAQGRLSATQAARPASKVGANAPAGRNPDRMSTSEWMAFERERLRRSGGR